MLPEVILDGESVTFEGEPPATLGALRALLESAVAAQGRVLAAFVVDGAQPEDGAEETPFGAARRVEAASLPVAEAVARLAAPLAPEFARLAGEADTLACAVTREPWDEVGPRCVRFIEAVASQLQRVIDLASALGEGTALAAAVTALATAVETTMQAVLARDAAAVCLGLDQTVLPALEQLRRELGAAASS